ncbi:pyocin immunity protein [Enterobacter cloacae]|nr:pyocin immunity protein [Enterobacter cloacae]
MTVNVEALIHSFGKSYQNLVDAELIPYKTPPTGFSGDPDLSLNMALEGVYLSFRREGRILQEITAILLRPEIKGWHFPNKLPFGLKSEMSRQWIHEHFGEPLRSSPPKTIMRRALGWVDLFDAATGDIPVSMQIDYDVMDNALSVTFMPTSELRW